MDADEKAITLYWLDLVSFRAVRGSGPVYGGLVLPDADTSYMMLGRLDGSLAKAEAVDLNILDRSALHVGQIVVSASDVGGQIGVVTGVTTLLDLAQLDDRGKATKKTRGVPPSGVRRVRALSLGDYVVSGPWLGRVVEVSLDVEVVFDDGAVCRVSDVESKDLRPVNPQEYYRPHVNTALYPRQRVVTGDSAAVFKEARWLNGHWKPDREVGTVVGVEMAGVSVYWIASAQHGTGEKQLVHESSAPPPAYQTPDSLTFVCSAPDCAWCFSDRCFLIDDDASGPLPDSSHPDNDQQHHARWAPQPTMTVCRTRTTVDVLWQDGTRQHGAPSTSLAPFSYMNEHEVFPGQYVVDNTPTDGTTGEDIVVVGAGSARRVGIVRSVNSKDHTVNVAWFKTLDPAGIWEVECDDTVTSVYDLGRDPDYSVFYGDVVVRLLSDITGGTPPVQEKSAPVDLSWVGHVVDLHDDGHVQVKWGDGSKSSVLPHEICIANKEDYTQLLAEMVADDDDDDDDDDDEEEEEEEGEEEEEDVVVNDPHQELGDVNTDNHQHNLADARNVEGGMAEGSDGSVNEELDGHAATTLNVEVDAHVTTCTNEDPNVGSTITEGGLALVTTCDASDDDGDSAEDVVVIKATYATGESDPFNFPNFNVVGSPPSDHHFLDNMEEGSSCGKKWVKTVQTEWKILESILPDTIYMQSFEDRMDLLRVVMVGASGTPYHNGLFFFDLKLPPTYPAVPPQVYYHSFGLRLNPNLYESGAVCLSLLNTFDGEGTEVWSPGMSSLLQIVVSLQALILNDQPYYNEADYEQQVDTIEGHRNAPPYSEKAYLLTLRTALHVLRRPPNCFEEFVRHHFRQCGRYVLDTCQAYLNGRIPCSTGFRIALANMVPRLVAIFIEIGAESCDHC